MIQTCTVEGMQEFMTQYHDSSGNNPEFKHRVRKPVGDVFTAGVPPTEGSDPSFKEAPLPQPLSPQALTLNPETKSREPLPAPLYRFFLFFRRRFACTLCRSMDKQMRWTSRRRA